MSALCLSPSRSLVAPDRGLGGLPLAAPWWRSLVGSALASGACRWRLRASARAFSGAVVVGFSSSSAAGRCGGVSVPVCAPPGARSLASPPPLGLSAPVWVARVSCRPGLLAGGWWPQVAVFTATVRSDAPDQLDEI